MSKTLLLATLSGDHETGSHVVLVKDEAGKMTVRASKDSLESARNYAESLIDEPELDYVGGFAAKAKRTPKAA